MPIPYRVILGADWLAAEVSSWDVRGCILRVGREGSLQTIACRSQYEVNNETQRGIKRECREQEDKDGAKLAHQRMVDAVRGMGEEGADILARPSPKHYKCFKNKAKLIPIKEMLRCAKQQQSAGATAALIYPRLIEVEAGQGLQDQWLGFLTLQAGIKGKERMQLEGINDDEVDMAESRGSGGMEAKYVHFLLSYVHSA